jgi:anaerobic ribonucleoside-triphosphate reductase activating protein
VKIHKILPVSRANGPGLRFVVWVQGCNRRCSGCFNPDTHNPNGGNDIAVSEIITQIPPEVSGITVSGGEPFEQAEELAVLLEEAGQMGLNRLVYTGFTYEELVEKKSKPEEKCLMLTDMLIDGVYLQDVPPYMPWTGSGNQRLIQLNGGQIQKVYKKGDFEKTGLYDGELIIDQNGGITVTGIINME